MAGPSPLCSLVPDVTGGVRAGGFSASQRRFLTLFLGVTPDRLRAVWLTHDGRSLGPVVDPNLPPPEAMRVKVYRLCGDGGAFKGALGNYRVLDLAHLAALSPLWGEPLRTLNDAGRRIGEQAAEPTLHQTFRLPGNSTPVAYRQTAADFAWLKAEAARCACTVTDIINTALAEYQERRQ